jgi:hypothetical protein
MMTQPDYLIENKTVRIETVKKIGYFSMRTYKKLEHIFTQYLNFIDNLYIIIKNKDK